MSLINYSLSDRFRNIKIKTLVFPGGTDSRFVRRVSNKYISSKNVKANNGFVFFLGKYSGVRILTNEQYTDIAS